MGMPTPYSEKRWGCHLHHLRWYGYATYTFFRNVWCHLHPLQDGDVICIALEMWDATSTFCSEMRMPPLRSLESLNDTCTFFRDVGFHLHTLQDGEVICIFGGCGMSDQPSSWWGGRLHFSEIWHATSTLCSEMKMPPLLSLQSSDDTYTLLNDMGMPPRFS